MRAILGGIDSACKYTNGTSERYAGEFISPGRQRSVAATSTNRELSDESEEPLGLTGIFLGESSSA